MDINIRPAKHGGEQGGRGREEDKPPYRHFGVAVATWGSYNALMYGAMAAVSDHGPPTGDVQRCHSLGRDITGPAKYPPDNQTS